MRPCLFVRYLAKAEAVVLDTGLLLNLYLKKEGNSVYEVKL